MNINKITGLSSEVSLFKITVEDPIKSTVTNQFLLFAAGMFDAVRYANEWIKNNGNPNELDCKVDEYKSPLTPFADSLGVDEELIERARLADEGYSNGTFMRWSEEQKRYYDRSLEIVGRVEGKLKDLIKDIELTQAARCLTDGRSKPQKLFPEVIDLPEETGVFAVQAERNSILPWRKLKKQWLVIAKDYEDARDWAVNKVEKENSQNGNLIIMTYEVDAGRFLAQQKAPSLVNHLENLDDSSIEDPMLMEVTQALAREASAMIKSLDKTEKAQRAFKTIEHA